MSGGGNPADHLASTLGGLNLGAAEGGSSSREPGPSSSSVTPGHGRAAAVSAPAADRPGLLTCQVLSCLATTGKNGSPLLACTGCRYVAYCCKDHQKLDWSLHKLFCKNVGEGGPLAPEVPWRVWMTEGMNDEQRGRWYMAGQELESLKTNPGLITNPYRHAAFVERAKTLLSDLEASLGRGHVGTVWALHVVAVLYINRAMYDDALSFTLRALKIVDDRFGSEDIKNALYLSHYSVVLSGLGRFEEGFVQDQRCLRMVESARGLNSTDTAFNLNNVATGLNHLGRLDEAVPLIRRSLAIMTAREGAASRSDRLDKTRSNLATMLGQLGRFDDAQPLFEAALKSAELAEGRNSVNYARVSSNYATFMRDCGQGDPIVIVDMLENAINVLERMHGERDLVFIMKLGRCAEANADLGRWQRASNQMNRCATLTSDEYGPGHAKAKAARERAEFFKSNC